MHARASAFAVEVKASFDLDAAAGHAPLPAVSGADGTLYLLALQLAETRGTLSKDQIERQVRLLRDVPDQIDKLLDQSQGIAALAEFFRSHEDFLYLGRGYNFPVALEGALKLKEISYIHAEGYPAAEMKHGPIALVDEMTPSVFLTPHGAVYDKVMSNLEEIKARGGPIIAIACEDDAQVQSKADDTIHVPNVPEYLQPLVTAIPMQLLAYHIALLRGCDIDKPRNLAKSVTVE